MLKKDVVVRLIRVLFLFLFFINLESFGKIFIFTYAFNRPDFIELQHKTFNKFLKDSYELIVFSDAKTPSMHSKIKLMCDRYNLQCIRVPQKIHTMPYLERPEKGWTSNLQCPSVRNANAVHYSLDMLGFKHDDILLLVDSDLFLIKEFSVQQFLKEYDLAAPTRDCFESYPPHGDCKKSHPNIAPFKHLWVGLVFLNLNTMPNKETISFNCGYIYDNGDKVPLDTGGFTYYYLRDNPEARVKLIDWEYLSDLLCSECKLKNNSKAFCKHNTVDLRNIGLDEAAITFAQSWPLEGDRKKYRYPEFLLNGTFLHYRAASFGGLVGYHHKKTFLLNKFISKILMN